jgi:simple sugar transport system permease protein
MSELLTPFLEAAVRTATPLALAAVGEVVVERSGVINIGLEGAIIAGAFAALASAGTDSIAIGFAASATAGIATGLIAATLIAWVRTDQIVAGTAITLLALGVTGLLYRTLYGISGGGLIVPTTGPVPIPVLSNLPWIGPAFFTQPPTTYLVYLLGAIAWWVLARTHIGLAVRASGENPSAAISAGLDPRRLQAGALIFGGLCGGLAGGSLVLAQSGTFIEGMSAGRGFIAIAIVVLGRWHPIGALAAALLFGAALALQFLVQATDSGIPYQLVLAIPYVLTLLVLAGAAGRAVAPAALGRAEVDAI